MTAARYGALNRVRAQLVERTEDWRWSSVPAHLAGLDDDLASVAPLLDRCAGRFADPDQMGTEAPGEALGGSRAARALAPEFRLVEASLHLPVFWDRRLFGSAG
jgi:hypothetical protein